MNNKKDDITVDETKCDKLNCKSNLKGSCKALNNTIFKNKECPFFKVKKIKEKKTEVKVSDKQIFKGED